MTSIFLELDVIWDGKLTKVLGYLHQFRFPNDEQLKSHLKSRDFVIGAWYRFSKDLKIFYAG